MTFIKTGGRGKTIPPPPTITASNGLTIAPANNVAIVGGNTMVTGWVINFGGSAGGSRIIDAGGIGNLMSISSVGNAGSSLALIGGSTAGVQGVIRLEAQVDALAIMRANNAAFKARIGDVARVEGGTSVYEVTPTIITETGPSGALRTVSATVVNVEGVGQEVRIGRNLGAGVLSGMRVAATPQSLVDVTCSGGASIVDIFTDLRSTSNARFTARQATGPAITSNLQNIRAHTGVNDSIALAPSRLALNQTNIELTTSGARNILVQSGNDLSLIVPNDVLRSVTIGASVTSAGPLVNLNGTLRIPGIDLLPRVFSNRYWRIRDQSGLDAYIPLFT